MSTSKRGSPRSRRACQTDRVRWAIVLVLAGTAFADPVKLPAKHEKELHRLLAKEPTAQRLLVLDTCTLKSSTGAAQVFTCKKRGCAGACQVISAEATVSLSKSGALRVRDVQIHHHGDTGECGCCTSTE